MVSEVIFPLSQPIDMWMHRSAMQCSLRGARVYGGALDWRDRWHRSPLHWAAPRQHGRAMVGGCVNGEPGEKRRENHGKTENQGKAWENHIKDVKMGSDLVESVEAHGNDL